MSDDCAAIILAAGASTRLGQPKQLVTIGTESLLVRSVTMAAEAALDPVFVVLGFEADRMAGELAGHKARIVVNDEWRAGMGSSLRRGMKAVLATDPLPGRVLILVCDQARLSAAHLRLLLQTSDATGAPIAASRYAARTGVPAVFRQPVYEDLLRVEGDQGARSVIQAHMDETVAVDFPEGIVDIDTPQDLDLLRSAG